MNHQMASSKYWELTKVPKKFTLVFQHGGYDTGGLPRIELTPIEHLVASRQQPEIHGSYMFDFHFDLPSLDGVCPAEYTFTVYKYSTVY